MQWLTEFKVKETEVVTTDQMVAWVGVDFPLHVCILHDSRPLPLLSIHTYSFEAFPGLPDIWKWAGDTSNDIG